MQTGNLIDSSCRALVYPRVYVVPYRSAVFLLKLSVIHFCVSSVSGL